MNWQTSKALPDINSDFPDCSGFPVFGAAIREVEALIKAPGPLIVSGALTAISVVAQGVFDVCLPIEKNVPCTLFQLVVAESGERKSAVEGVFLSPIRKFQKIQNLLWEDHVLLWEAADEVWVVKWKVLKNKIRSASVAGKELDDFEATLQAHYKLRPKRPKKIKLLHGDFTLPALLSWMSQNVPVVGVISSEGGLNGALFKDMHQLNSMWSGESVTVERKTTDSFEILNPRVTVSNMVQPSALEAFIKKHGDAARGSGLLARTLVLSPESTRGSRFLQKDSASWAVPEAFEANLEKLLDKNLLLLKSSDEEKEVVRFSPAAAERWRFVYNEIEAGIVEGGRFSGAGDLASKLSENIARVAALLHVFEGFKGGISLRTLEFSVAFCLWCSDEFYRVFMQPKEIDLDVEELRDWLRDKYLFGSYEIKNNEILQSGPRGTRTKKRRDAALDQLYALGLIDFSNDRCGMMVVLSDEFRSYL